MPLYIVNSTVDADGSRVPNLTTPITWVGHEYRKTGNVFKFLILTASDVITGDPGVFGPIPDSMLQAALDADQVNDYRGFHVDEIPSWSIGGYRPAADPVVVERIRERNRLIPIVNEPPGHEVGTISEQEQLIPIGVTLS